MECFKSLNGGKSSAPELRGEQRRLKVPELAGENTEKVPARLAKYWSEAGLASTKWV